MVEILPKGADVCTAYVVRTLCVRCASCWTISHAVFLLLLAQRKTFRLLFPTDTTLACDTKQDGRLLPANERGALFDVDSLIRVTLFCKGETPPIAGVLRS